MAEVSIKDLLGVVERNAKSNEKLSNSVDGPTAEVMGIHEKYRSFSNHMKLMGIQLGFLIALNFGTLFTIISKL